MAHRRGQPAETNDMHVVRSIWKLLVGIKDGLVLLAMLLFFGLLFAALSVNPAPTLPGSGALLLKLSGSIVEQPENTDPLALLPGSGPVVRQHRLRDIVHALDTAATSSAVKAVVLDLDGFMGGGQAAMATIGDALGRVRAAGKPVLAYATGYTDDGYQLAAHASEVWLDPIGAVLIAGPGGNQLYFKGLLDKIGVAPKVYRVGRFKSAVEPYTRAGQSPEARAANQALVDTLWQVWRDDVARARPKARIDAYVAATGGDALAPGSFAELATRAGLVDKIGDRIAFGRRVAAIAGTDNDKVAGRYSAIALDRWLAANPPSTRGAAIGVVTIAGTIVDGESPPGTAGGDTIAKLILEALAKNDLKALVVRVDSPGGSIAAQEKIRAAILEARAKGLPVVASFGSVAASAGYAIAMPATTIFAEPSTVTGSIGAFGILPTFRGTLDKLGLGVDGVRTTPLSGEPDIFGGTSPQFDRLMQRGIEHLYARFVAIVAEARHMTPARVDAIGQGHVWAGATAHQLGLVDRFGGLDDAVAEAAHLAKLDPKTVHALYIEEKPSLFGQFVASLAGKPEGGPSDAFALLAGRPEARLGTVIAELRALARGGAIQARCLECPVEMSNNPADTRTGWRLIERFGL